MRARILLSAVLLMLTLAHIRAEWPPPFSNLPTIPTNVPTIPVDTTTPTDTPTTIMPTPLPWSETAIDVALDMSPGGVCAGVYSTTATTADVLEVFRMNVSRATVRAFSFPSNTDDLLCSRTDGFEAISVSAVSALAHHNITIDFVSLPTVHFRFTGPLAAYLTEAFVSLNSTSPECLHNATCLSGAATSEYQASITQYPAPTLSPDTAIPSNGIGTTSFFLVVAMPCGTVTVFLTRLDTRMPGSAESAVVDDAEWPVLKLTFAGEESLALSERLLSMTMAEWTSELCVAHFYTRSSSDSDPQTTPAATPPASTPMPVPPPVQTANPNGVTSFGIFLSTACVGTTYGFLSRLQVILPNAMESVVVIDSDWPFVALMFHGDSAAAFTSTLLQLTQEQWGQKLCAVYYYTKPYALPTSVPPPTTDGGSTVTPQPTTFPPSTQPPDTFPPHTASPSGATEFGLLISTYDNCAPTLEAFRSSLLLRFPSAGTGGNDVVIRNGTWPYIHLRFNGTDAATFTNALLQYDERQLRSELCIMYLATHSVRDDVNEPQVTASPSSGQTLLAAILVQPCATNVSAFESRIMAVLQITPSALHSTVFVTSDAAQLPFVSFAFAPDSQGDAFTSAVLSMTAVERDQWLCIGSLSAFEHPDPKNGSTTTAPSPHQTFDPQRAAMIDVLLVPSLCRNVSQFLGKLRSVMAFTDEKEELALHSSSSYPLVQFSFAGPHNVTRIESFLRMTDAERSSKLCVGGFATNDAPSASTRVPTPLPTANFNGETVISVIVNVISCNSLDAFTARVVDRFGLYLQPQQNETAPDELLVEEVQWPYTRFRFSGPDAYQLSADFLSLGSHPMFVDEAEKLCIHSISSSAAQTNAPTASADPAAIIFRGRSSKDLAITAGIALPCVMLFLLAVVFAFYRLARRYRNPNKAGVKPREVQMQRRRRYEQLAKRSGEDNKGAPLLVNVPTPFYDDDNDTQMLVAPSRVEAATNSRATTTSGATPKENPIAQGGTHQSLAKPTLYTSGKYDDDIALYYNHVAISGSGGDGKKQGKHKHHHHHHKNRLGLNVSGEPFSQVAGATTPGSTAATGQNNVILPAEMHRVFVGDDDATYDDSAFKAEREKRARQRDDADTDL